MKKHTILACYFCLLLFACGEDKAIKETYSIAEGNKTELEKVIAHFKNENDELKLEAARFLIGQMRFNYATQALSKVNDSIKNRFATIHEFAKKIAISDSLFRQKTVVDSMKPFVVDHVKQVDQMQPSGFFLDARLVKAEELIKYIDKMVWVWKNSRFAKGTTKQEFFESILPYRIRYEPLDLHTQYSDLYSSFFCDDAKVIDSKKANIKLNNYLKCFFFSKKGQLSYTHKGLYSALEMWGKECIDRTTYATKILRSVGVPTYIDFTPQWSDRIANRRHFWCAIKYRNQAYKLFSPPHDLIDDSITYAYIDNAPKVFRYRAIPNTDAPFFQRTKQEYIPVVFGNPYVFDVTDEHFETTTINLTVDKPQADVKHCYLATFNAPEWSPVAFSQFSGNNVNFEKVRANHLYAVIAYPNGSKPTVISTPFYVNKNGSLTYLNAGEKTTIRVFQKYQQKMDPSWFTANVVGAKVQVANTWDFSDAETLYQVPSYPQPILYSIPLHVQKKFRYARMISNKERKSLNITHLEFHTNKPDEKTTAQGIMPYVLSEISSDSLRVLKQATKLEGKVYCSTKKWMSKPMLKERLEACDGKYETWTNSAEVSFDFGKPVKVSSCRFAPRHADNWIVSGQHYALFYYDNAWKKAGVKKAKYNFIEFDCVPSNTMYWLRNLDTGREEQAFVYINGKQLFVNTKEFRTFDKTIFR